MPNMVNAKLAVPHRLTPGQTIGIVAPSAGNAGAFPHRVEQAVQSLTDLGFKVKFAKHARENRDYVSADARLRAEDINDMFADPEIATIMCTIGGDHSNQILKYIDFEAIRHSPKIFVGYSDISVLHYALAAKANLQTFYGPCLVTEFGEYPKPLDYTLDHFLKATMNAEPIGNIVPSAEWTCEILDWRTQEDRKRSRKLLPSTGYYWLRQGKSSGIIVGGCVPSINHLTGTEFWIDPIGCVFFIDVPEGHEFGTGLQIHELDAYLADLDNLGVFKNIVGLIVGKPYRYSDEQNEQLRRLIASYVEPYNYPVLMDVNIGHASPIITLPLGAEVTLDAEHD
ncbi:MAG: LD-carboxypeptidase, partial [Candidatus Uhrbacteria bacterium]|nr:LD-carboxypeptidase [Candidatus Uhrbacteria bacterium]